MIGSWKWPIDWPPAGVIMSTVCLQPLTLQYGYDLRYRTVLYIIPRSIGTVVAKRRIVTLFLEILADGIRRRGSTCPQGMRSPFASRWWLVSGGETLQHPLKHVINRSGEPAASVRWKLPKVLATQMAGGSSESAEQLEAIQFISAVDR